MAGAAVLAIAGYREHQGAHVGWFLVLVINAALLADAQHTFNVLHTWLGETIGYAMTATLIATGIVIPLGVSAAGLTNFAGYVLWCVWLIATAITLWPAPRAIAPRSNGATTAAPGVATVIP